MCIDHVRMYQTGVSVYIALDLSMNMIAHRIAFHSLAD